MSTISLRTFSRPWAFALCLIPGALPACIDATETATECSKNISALGGLCPAGTAPKFSTAAHGNCNASGKYEATDESVNASGQCVSDGTCEIDCVPTGMICPCGVASYGHDTVNCRTDCSPGCGDGTCAESETNETCPADCVQPAQDGGGTSADSSATGGAGGSGGDSASGGKGGTSPKGGSGGTTAGTGGAAAGDAAGASGATGNETASSSECNEPKTYGRYLVRDDGALLLVDASGKGSQTAVLDKSTVKPLAHVVAASDAGTIGCALIDDGTVACWQTAANANAHGALGNGTLETDGALLKATTVVTGPAAPLEHVTQFAQASSDGAGGICAITDAHELYCWGALDWLVNGGKGLNSPYAQPITLDGLETMTGVKQAAIAFGGGCALRDGDDGNEVWCWGAGRNAQLPDSKDSQYPVRILGLTNPTEVAADGTFVYDYVPIHTYCAIDDGNVRCWGSMAHGEGGDDDAPNATSTPSLVKIGNGTELSGVTALTGAGNAGITSGSGNFCALRGSALWCWGAQFGRHASNYGATNVTMLGDARGPTFLTNDEVLHVGSTLVTPNCGKL